MTVDNFDRVAECLAHIFDGTLVHDRDGEASPLRGRTARIFLNSPDRKGLRLNLAAGHLTDTSKLHVTVQFTEDMLAADGHSRASTMACKDLKVSASLARSPRTIARHIEENVLLPAIGRLESWRGFLQVKGEQHKILLKTIDRLRETFPSVTVDPDPDAEMTAFADFRASAHGAYIKGKLSYDGTLYLDHSTWIRGDALSALLTAMGANVERAA